MYAEQKVRDLAGRYTYHRDYTEVTFRNPQKLEEFAYWCSQNGYTCLHRWPELRAVYFKDPIHIHRIEDAARYPNLQIGKEVR